MCAIRGRWRWRRREAVDDRLTRPRRLLREPLEVNYRTLRRLILSRKLAPCFDALDDPRFDLEECPICFLYYPSLNRSKCCTKGICTECFLQMMPSDASRPAQCPFCKTSSYAVEYRGRRTVEETDIELAEEQKVIEAKIRMQHESEAKIRMQHESETVNNVVLVGRNQQSLSGTQTPFSDMTGPSCGDSFDASSIRDALLHEHVDGNTSITYTNSFSRSEELDVDLEDVMVMEAIWLSLQDSGSQKPQTSISSASSSSIKDETDQASEPTYAGPKSPSSDHKELFPLESQPNYRSSIGSLDLPDNLVKSCSTLRIELNRIR